MYSIQGARLVDPANVIDAVTDVHIQNGQILATGDAPEGFVASQTLQAEGQLLLPGAVDLSFRAREPGQAQKASLATELEAAARSGVTAVAIPPDTAPVIESQAVVEQIHNKVRAAGDYNVYPLGALTAGLQGQLLAPMGALQAAGCVAVSNALQPLADTLVLRRAMEYAHSLGLTVFLFSEDAQLAKGGCVHEGETSTRLGLPYIPTAAEVVGLARDLALVEQTGVKAHFCRLSTARGVEMIAEAKRRGLPVTADVAAHQLVLADTDIEQFNAQYHVKPPLRTNVDREVLIQGVIDGSIDAICSDHQPHEPDAKLAPFPATEAGISAVDTLLPIVLDLVSSNALPLATAIAAITVNPARILGIDYQGLVAGQAANAALVEQRSWQLSADAMASVRSNTPFLGRDFGWRVRCGVVNGRPFQR